MLSAKPSKAAIIYHNAVLESGSEIVANEGDQLRLSCVVNGGKPAPKVSWRRLDNNRNGLGIEMRNISNNVTTVILVKELTRTELTAKYECRIEHETISPNTSSMDSNVTINVNGK